MKMGTNISTKKLGANALYTTVEYRIEGGTREERLAELQELQENHDVNIISSGDGELVAQVEFDSSFYNTIEDIVMKRGQHDSFWRPWDKPYIDSYQQRMGEHFMLRKP